MDAIYIYDGDYSTGDEGLHLVRLAAAKHLLETGAEGDPQRAEIARTERGKPYFADLSLQFSLTHSGLLWMCMFSEGPCGIDLQEMRECDHLKLSERFFLPAEAASVRDKGMEEFFRIWVRKEAYAKMTGTGLLWEKLPEVLSDEGEFDGSRYYLTEIEISDEMKCAICTAAPADPQLRALV